MRTLKFAHVVRAACSAARQGGSHADEMETDGCVGSVMRNPPFSAPAPTRFGVLAVVDVATATAAHSPACGCDACWSRASPRTGGSTGANGERAVLTWSTPAHTVDDPLSASRRTRGRGGVDDCALTPSADADAERPNRAGDAGAVPVGVVDAPPSTAPPSLPCQYSRTLRESSLCVKTVRCARGRMCMTAWHAFQRTFTAGPDEYATAADDDDGAVDAGGGGGAPPPPPGGETNATEVAIVGGAGEVGSDGAGETGAAALGDDAVVAPGDARQLSTSDAFPAEVAPLDAPPPPFKLRQRGGACCCTTHPDAPPPPETDGGAGEGWGGGAGVVRGGADSAAGAAAAISSASSTPPPPSDDAVATSCVASLSRAARPASRRLMTSRTSSSSPTSTHFELAPPLTPPPSGVALAGGAPAIMSASVSIAFLMSASSGHARSSDRRAVEPPSRGTSTGSTTSRTDRGRGSQ